MLRSLLVLIVLVFVLQYYVEFCFPFAGWFTVTSSEPPPQLDKDWGSLARGPREAREPRAGGAAAPDSLSRLRFTSPAPARAPSPQDSRPPWDALFISSPSYISLPRVIFKGCEFSDLIKTINPTRGVSPVGRLGLASCTCQN